MTNQFIFWLYPVLVLALVSLVFRITLPWKWSWGFTLQSILLGALSIVGLAIGPAWLYAIVGWALTFIFFYLPKRFYDNVQKDLTALDAPKLRQVGRNIKLLFWGMAGEFWCDMAESLALYVERKPIEADALLSKWERRTRNEMPKTLLQLPQSYRLIGKGVLWRWTEIIDEYEKLKAEAAKVPSVLTTSAARAYLETGQYEKAAQALSEARLADSNMTLDTLALTLLPFFALTGAVSQTDQLVAIVSSKRGAFPEAAKFYWQGRCRLVSGDIKGGKELLEKAASVSSSELLNFRIETVLQQSDNSAPVTGRQDLINSAWEIFQRCAFVQELISPRRKSVAVITIIAVVAFVFVLTEYC